jgi:hypothetical protein
MIEVGRHPETAGQRIWPCWQVADALEAHSARHRIATQADALAVMREAQAALADLAAEKPGARPRALRTLANLRAYLAQEGEQP